jgi:hypothetical protein
MGDMGFPSFTIDQYVIKQYKDKIMNNGIKYFFHETLEGGRCIAKARGGRYSLALQEEHLLVEVFTQPP